MESWPVDIAISVTHLCWRPGIEVSNLLDRDFDEEKVKEICRDSSRGEL